MSAPYCSTVASILPFLTSGCTGRDVVEADDLDLAAQARRVERLDDAERHRVVGRHHALDVVILGEEVGHQRVGFLGLPMRGLAVEQLQLALRDRVHEALLALNGVVGLGVALENDDLAARPELLGERVARELRPGAVVGAEEGEVDSGRFLGVLVEFDVDVDDHGRRP